MVITAAAGAISVEEAGHCGAVVAAGRRDDTFLARAVAACLWPLLPGWPLGGHPAPALAAIAMRVVLRAQMLAVRRRVRARCAAARSPRVHPPPPPMARGIPRPEH